MGIALITKDYENTVGKQRMPVIVEFYASWCPKCGMMYPVVERISSRYQKSVDIQPEFFQKKLWKNESGKC